MDRTYNCKRKWLHTEWLKTAAKLGHKQVIFSTLYCNHLAALGSYMWGALPATTVDVKISENAPSGTHPSLGTGVMLMRGGVGKTREQGLDTGSSSGERALSACLQDKGGNCKVPEWRLWPRRRSTPRVLPGGCTTKRSLLSCGGHRVRDRTDGLWSFIRRKLSS